MVLHWHAHRNIKFHYQLPSSLVMVNRSGVTLTVEHFPRIYTITDSELYTYVPSLTLSPSPTRPSVNGVSAASPLLLLILCYVGFVLHPSNFIRMDRGDKYLTYAYRTAQ